MFVVYKKCITFALGNNKTQRFKKIDYANHAFFFYGFYFYFAEQAERDVAYHNQRV